MLSIEQKRRVAAALNFDPEVGDIVRLVECLETPEEFHQFVLNYNPNDGLLPLWTITKSSNCDQGTALCIYWLLADYVLEREKYRNESNPKWDGVGLIEEIESRMANDFYTRKDIRYVPMDFLGWSHGQVKIIQHKNGGTLPFPEGMLDPSLGEVVPLEHIQ